MHWRYTLLAGLGLAVVVALAMLLEWFAGERPYEHHLPLLTGPQSCVLTMGHPSNTSSVLDIYRVIDTPACLFQRRYFVQMQGVEVWSDADAVQIEPYALLAGRQVPLPPGDVVFAVDGFGIKGIAIRGMPRYVRIIFRFMVHTDEAHHMPPRTTVVMAVTGPAGL
jgi:hypothetical protein